MGRPSTYKTRHADEICHLIATTSMSMKAICERLNLPVRTVLHWLNTKEDFLQKYARAKEQQADFLAEEILEIADDSSNDTIEGQYGPMENKEWVNRSRLRVDSRKWIASKLKPKKFGDRVDVTSGGEKIQPDYSGLDNKDLAMLAALQAKANGPSKDTKA